MRSVSVLVDRGIGQAVEVHRRDDSIPEFGVVRCDSTVDDRDRDPGAIGTARVEVGGEPLGIGDPSKSPGSREIRIAVVRGTGAAPFAGVDEIRFDRSDPRILEQQGCFSRSHGSGETDQGVRVSMGDPPATDRVVQDGIDRSLELWFPTGGRHHLQLDQPARESGVRIVELIPGHRQRSRRRHSGLLRLLGSRWSGDMAETERQHEA